MDSPALISRLPSLKALIRFWATGLPIHVVKVGIYWDKYVKHKIGLRAIHTSPSRLAMATTTRWAQRCVGIFRLSSTECAPTGSSILAVIALAEPSDTTGPGHTRVTETLRSATSIRNVLKKPWTAYLLVEYEADITAGSFPAVLLMHTIWPAFLFSMDGRTALVTDMVPTTFKSSIALSTAVSVSSARARCDLPALLIRTSICPKWFKAVSAAPAWLS